MFNMYGIRSHMRVTYQADGMPSYILLSSRKHKALPAVCDAAGIHLDFRVGLAKVLLNIVISRGMFVHDRVAIGALDTLLQPATDTHEAMGMSTV